VTTAWDAELVAAAQTTIDAAGDGRLHTVAAAVRDTAGGVHTGINLFHFTGGPCAELVALATATKTSSRPLSLIVAVGDAGRGVLPPCGRCRQVMLDLHPDIQVMLADGSVVAISDLLPVSYQWREGS
jgi:cytidine deaminase